MSDETAGDGGKPQGPWQKWWGRTRRTFAATTTTLAALFFLWIVWLLAYETFRKHGIEIEAIAVPKEFADSGFTADVATRRLRDAVKAVEERAQTTMRKADVEVDQEVDQEIPEITIHEAGVPIAGLSRSIRHWLPDDWRHLVSGEFIRSGATISLRLRLNGRVIFPESDVDRHRVDRPIDEPALDELIDRAALKLVEAVQPSLAAIYFYYQGNSPAAEQLATRIIFERPSSDENVARAYNLKGLLAWNDDKYVEAEEYFAKSNYLAVSLLNLGLLYLSHGHHAKALAKFRDASLVDGRLAQAHFAMGTVWDTLLEQSKLRGLEVAAANPPGVFWLDPEFGYASVDVDNIDQGTLDDVIIEYRLAAWLDPTFSLPREKLGNLLIAQNKWSEAAVDLREAIVIDRSKYKFDNTYRPELIKLQLMLAQVLQAGGRPVEAIDSLNEAIRLDPEEPNLQYLLAMRLKEFAVSATTGRERSGNLHRACAAVVKAASLIGSDKGDNSLIGDINAGIAAIDAALQDGSRCPPESGATITLDWVRS